MPLHTTDLTHYGLLNMSLKTVGDYILKEKIGKGSYADVFRGTHRTTGIKYAIKSISKEILSEPKLVAGLESEIKIMREFAHQNIVCLHEYFSSEKNFYLVLELCEGGDLSKFIRKKKRLDERLAHNFLSQITSGLAFLHGKNFIHRDLKPANVLMTESSEGAILKLADFGFAKQLNVAALAQTRCGTPLYMAPEILESRDYDGKADVWSVGCIFYEMLVGTSPFKGTSEPDLLMNIKTKELNVPKDVILSKVSIEILIKLLERQPIRRAALSQLVALCAHLNTSLPPAPVQDIEGLPVPPIASSESKHPAGESQESCSEPSSGLQQATRGGYNGGPAPSNLREMLSAPSSQTIQAHSPSHYEADSRHPVSDNNSHHPATPQKLSSSPQDAYKSRRYSASNAAGAAQSAPQSETQFSKTLRASYAPAPSNRYGSPSSSPVQAGHLQGSHATRTQLPPTPSSSPASGTIGMVGNLIAYVFNPSPSPSSIMGMGDSNRAHGSQQRGMPHGRTVSLDRAGPSFPPNAGYFTSGGGGGGGTPPPSAKSTRSLAAGQPRERGIKEEHFNFADQSDINSSNNTNNNNNANPGSRSPNPNGSSLSDDGFVMINSTASNSGGGERKQQMQQQPSGNYSSDPSSQNRNQGGSPPNSGENSTIADNYNSGNNNNDNNFNGTQGNNNAPQPIVYDYERDGRANEIAAMQAFYASTVQRCQVLSAVVATITSLGDHYAREGQAPLQKLCSGSQMQSDAGTSRKSTAGPYQDEMLGEEDDKGIAGFLNHPPDSSVFNPHLKQVAVDRHLVACSLYLHALSILTRLLKSFDANPSSDQSGAMKEAVGALRSNLINVHQQLIARAESCQKHIDAMVNPDSGFSSSSTTNKYMMPQAEPIMIQAALKQETDAGLEELLGNLTLASKLYQSANELVEGVALTANPEDQRKLQVYSNSLMEKHNACKKRAIELNMGSI